MTFIGYLREVLRLLRTAHDNPVVVHSRPWKARGFPCFMWWAQIAFVPLCLAVALWVHIYVEARTSEIVGGMNVPFVWGGSAIMFSINLLLFASPWSNRERLEELWLTTVPSREVAFGSIFWPVIAGALVPVGAWLSTIACIVLRPHDWLANWGGFTPWPLVLLLVEAFAMVAAAFVALTYWFQYQRQRWRMLLIVPALFGLVSGWMAAGAGFLAAGIDELVRGARGDVVVVVLFCIVAPIFALVAARVAGRLATTRFWSPVFPEALQRLSVFDCAAAIRRDPQRKARARALLREWIPVRHGEAATVWFACAVVLVLAEAVSPHPEGYAFLRRAWNPWLLTLHLMLCVMVLAAMETVRGGGFDGFRMVPGRFLGSLERRFGAVRWLYVALVMLGSAISFAERARGDDAWSAALAVVGVGFGALFVGSALIGVVAWAIGSRRPKIAMSTVAAAWCAALVAYLFDDVRPTARFWPRMHGAEWMQTVWAVGMWLAATLSAFSFQRLHTRSLLRQHLWGDDPFDPIMPVSPPADPAGGEPMQS